MGTIESKKKKIKREIADLKLELSQKKKKLERKKEERTATYLEHKKKTLDQLREYKTTLFAKNQKLETKIAKLEKEIRNEKRMLLKVIEVEQHEAIDHLENYLDEVDHKYENLRGFWKTVKKEFRDLMRNKKSKK